MKKSDIKKDLFYYVKYLPLPNKTIKTKHSTAETLTNDIIKTLEQNIKISNISFLLPTYAILKEEDNILYVFKLPCYFRMKNLNFEAEFIIVIFKDSDIEYYI